MKSASLTSAGCAERAEITHPSGRPHRCVCRCPSPVLAGSIRSFADGSRLGSGPFTPGDTQMQLLDPLSGASANVSPTWEWECTFGQVCQSGTASLSGGASTASNHQNYTSPAGFIAGLTTGASASWQVLGAPSGDATVTVRYSNYIGSLGGPAPRTISLVVNGTSYPGHLAGDVGLDDWATVTEPVSLTSGTEYHRVDLRER